MAEREVLPKRLPDQSHNRHQTVNCTFVNGIFDHLISPMLLRTATLPANSTPVQLGVSASADNGGANFAAPSISCYLPPGVDIGAVNRVYPEDVGA